MNRKNNNNTHLHTCLKKTQKQTRMKLLLEIKSEHLLFVIIIEVQVFIRNDKPTTHCVQSCEHTTYIQHTVYTDTHIKNITIMI